METNAVVVLLVGLPGSGKTTLCRALKSHHEDNPGSGRLMVIHVCYDDLIPLSLQREFVKQKRSKEQGNGDAWKGTAEEDKRNLRIRENGSKDRESIEEDKEGEENNSGRQVISEDWKSARQKIHGQVDQLLQYVITGKTESGVQAFFGIPREALESGTKYVILLDDNFYYQSMRYEYYQLARRHSAAFCQLYLQCTVEEAVRHNAMREERVPAGVVTAMGERLQAPQSHLHAWEANTCVLQGGVDQVCQAWAAAVQSLQCGLTPMQDRAVEVSEARRRCSQSVVHQADLCLRVIVKHLVKGELQRAGERHGSASQAAARVNAARQTVLAGLRGGGVEVPCRLADAVTQGNRCEFEAFLAAQMKKIISE